MPCEQCICSWITNWFDIQIHIHEQTEHQKKLVLEFVAISVDGMVKLCAYLEQNTRLRQTIYTYNAK